MTQITTLLRLKMLGWSDINSFATTHQIIARGEELLQNFHISCETMELGEEQATMLNTAHGTDLWLATHLA